jgi:hypothetical protein
LQNYSDVRLELYLYLMAPKTRLRARRYIEAIQRFPIEGIYTGGFGDSKRLMISGVSSAKRVLNDFVPLGRPVGKTTGRHIGRSGFMASTRTWAWGGSHSHHPM